MSIKSASRPPGETAFQRRRLLTPNLVRLFVVAFGANASFYTPLSVLPQLVQTQTDSSTAAGATTAVLMLATVVTEVFSVRLMRMYSPARLLALGVGLLGFPTLALVVLTPTLPLILVVSAIRGVGFAFLVVAGGTIAANCLPSQRRGEGMGIYGIVVGVPAIACLPLGLLTATTFGHLPVFIITAASAIVVLPLTRRLHDGAATTTVPTNTATGDSANLIAPAMAFLGTTIASGVIVTFLPITFASLGHATTIAITCQSLVATLARWLAGRIGDRRGHQRLIAPGVALASVGVAAQAIASTGPSLIAAMIIFGVGFGIAMSATLAVMLERVSHDRYSTVSAVWNLAYDIGWVVGPVGFGVMATLMAYQTAYLWLAAAVALPMVVVLRRVGLGPRHP